MVDRFLMWLGTGVVITGVSAAVLAGAGVANATDGDSSDSGGTKTSESSDSAGNKDDSGAGKTSPSGLNTKDDDKQGDERAGAKPNSDKDAKDEDAKDETTGEDAKDETTGEDAKDETTGEDAKDETTGEDAKDETTGEDAKDETTGDELLDETTGANGEADEVADSANVMGSWSNDAPAGDPQALRWTPTVVEGLDISAETDIEVEKKDALLSTEPEAGEEHAVVPLATEFEELGEQAETPAFRSMAFASPETVEINATASAQPLNLLLDLVGTIVFGLYGLVIQAVGGPPMLPPGSSVTVYSSRLRIDCGCAPGEGKEVPVDWYIPENADQDRIIYLQHGFLAAGPWYSYTAATLAEQTNSIVVAPSITSNFLAYDQCWLGGAPMHQAMAGLFDPDNTALADSLAATPYDGELKWKQAVLMGHSAGGGAVSGIARYMTENGDADRLVGVVLLDGVGMSGKMAEDLSIVPDNVPIYQLAAPKYMWNMFGSGTAALIEARPEADFYGVTLVGGSHVDTMRGGNVLIQFAQQLVSGFSQPQNVAAAEILMVGWVNDMFAEPGETPKGIYLTTGETLTIDTPGGPATVVDLPNSLRRPYLLNFLEPFMALSGGLFTLQPGCLRESDETAASCTESVAA